MPVPDQRDPEVTRAVLTRWLAERSPGAARVAVTALEIPQTTGFSAETLLFDADRDGRAERLVAKVAPSGFQVFLDPMPYADQYRLLCLLEKAGVPVPPTRWFEPDPDLLGAPFYVTERVDGVVPEDFPPYHQAGWVSEAAPETRARIWWSGLEVLARLHRLDPAPFTFLDRPEYGPPGLGQRLGYYARYLNWACPVPHPTCARALRWLRENRPDEPDPPVLLWGDGRIGNIIYGEDGTPRAVLDWEIATLGAPEEDLAWYLFLDRHHSEGIGVPRLPGFPSYDETIACYEELAGRPMRDMAYYEVLSAFKFAVIMARIGRAFIASGLVPPDSDFPIDNTASRLLAAILDLPAPGPGTGPAFGETR